MPEITLSLPAALGLLALFLSIGAVLVYFALRQTGQVAAEAPATVTPTMTVTPTPSTTPTEVPPTITATPLPSPTPMAYTVKLGDSCGTIAAQFGISIQSIILLNDLSATCGIFEGQKLQIPQPTPTSTPLPTATLSPAEATVAACPKVEYTVQSSDTLSAISANYAVPMEAIREFNGLVSDTVRVGQKLVIPLCRRASTPGPTPTATLPPPYSAPQLLLPADGTAFRSAGEVITLQWSSVGTLREDESYQVILEDLTGGENRKVFDYLTDTKYIVPDDLRAADGSAHVYRWTVTTVRQTGTDDDGKPIWESAGATSPARVFVWSGSGAPPATQAP